MIDSLDVSYGDMWGSHQGPTHPDPMPSALAARRHAAGMPYAVLLSSGERPLALIERWPRGRWRLYLFDDASRRARMIDFVPLGTDKLLGVRNTRLTSSDEQGDEAGSESGEGRSRERIPHCLVPEFGDWRVFAPFLAQQGHEPAADAVLNDVSVEEGAGPLRPTGVERLFVPGSRDTPDGPAAVELGDAGMLRITSGQLAVTDPGFVSNPRTVAVPPGEYPVTLSLLRTARSVEVAAARVTFHDAPPHAWEMALRPDEDPGLLGEGEFYGVGVDSGTVAFMDAIRAVDDEMLDDEVLDEQVFVPLSFVDRPSVELPGTGTGPNLVAFTAGRGDGSYPVWIGRTEDGQAACVVVDFRLHPTDRKQGDTGPSPA
ncbi:DUF4241 domain-containing protein [Streptomyces lusitanus]|uniref:DUF4241 domain-containing protein n=1 Tax=Streptomyces lusitanus TaxID=68232 RepID=A0ABU3JNY7_9ACTN|nr:DUF4241 domain-containing protein [Streptomyces lusitanus]